MSKTDIFLHEFGVGKCGVVQSTEPFQMLYMSISVVFANDDKIQDFIKNQWQNDILSRSKINIWELRRHIFAVLDAESKKTDTGIWKVTQDQLARATAR